MILFQLFLFVVQGVVFSYSSSTDPDLFIILLSASTVLVNYCLFMRKRKRTYLKRYNFSIILFFIVMTFIISFQIPIEIAFGNHKLLSSEYRLISNQDIVNRMVAYSSLMMNIFLIGASFSLYNLNKHNVAKNISTKSIKLTPLFFILVISFLIFVFNINEGYIDGGHGTVSFDGIGNSFLVIFTRLSIVYLSIVIYNQMNSSIKTERTLFGFFSLFDKSYLIFILLIALIFLSAHNRVYVLYSVTPLIFAFFVFSKKTISKKTIILSFFSILVLSTLFKLYGIKDMFSKGLTISSGYIISKSYSPFTAEIAGSIYSQSILFNEWVTNNLNLYGISYLVGVFRTIPGLMGALDISPLLYNTSSIATFISDAPYGVGTTIIADLLINFGLYLSIILFGFIGYIFSSAEGKVYAANAGLYSYITYFTITSFIIFVPRSSLDDFVGTLFFNLLFTKAYLLLFSKNKI